MCVCVELPQSRAHTHGLGFIQAAHADVAAVMAFEVQEVKRGKQPEVETWDPD